MIRTRNTNIFKNHKTKGGRYLICKSAPCCNSYSGEHFSFFGKNDRTDRNTPANGIIARLANSAGIGFAEP